MITVGKTPLHAMLDVVNVLVCDPFTSTVTFASETPVRFWTPSGKLNRERVLISAAERERSIVPISMLSISSIILESPATFMLLGSIVTSQSLSFIPRRV